MKNYQLLSENLSGPWLINEQGKNGLLLFIQQLIHGPHEAINNTHLKPENHLSAQSEDEINPSEEFIYWLFAFDPNSGRVLRLDRYSQAPQGSIALLNIHGFMMPQDTWFGPGTRTLSDMIVSAQNCNCISGVIFDFNTGGGHVTGTERLANTMKALTKRNVALGNAMYSAGYWTASSSNKIIITEKTGGAGSIGTMVYYLNMEPYYEKLGVQIIEEYATKSTEKNKDFNELLKGNKKAYVERTLDPLNELFHNSVKSSRPNINQTVKGVFAGQNYLAEEAVELGLADMIGTFQDAVKFIQTGQMQESQQPAAAEGSGSGSASGSGSSSAKSNSNQLNNIDMFNNYSAITAIANKQAKGQDITEADIQAVNDQLAAKGVSSFAFVSQSTASEAENTIAGLENTVNNLTALFGDDAKAEKFDLLAAVKKMKEDKEAAEAKVEEYGDQPGDKPTSAKKGDDNPDETMDWVDPEAEHNKIAAEMRSSN